MRKDSSNAPQEPAGADHKPAIIAHRFPQPGRAGDGLLSRREVSTILGVHTETVKRWGKSGRLRELTLGKTVVRYDPRDVQALIDQAAGGARG